MKKLPPKTTTQFYTNYGTPLALRRVVWGRRTKGPEAALLPVLVKAESKRIHELDISIGDIQRPGQVIVVQLAKDGTTINDVYGLKLGGT